MNADKYILIFSSPDKIGIVSSITSLLAEFYCNVLEAKQFADSKSNMFFMRCEFSLTKKTSSFEILENRIKKIFSVFKITGKIVPKNKLKKIAILVSKQSHCLIDVLHKFQNKELLCDIKCVISNHIDNQKLTEYFGIPFYFVPITENKKSHFEKIYEHLNNYKIDTLLLARYMQIIPANICKKYKDNIINIHHGFLPSFVGAKPYHQAYDKGVKIIGATGHYVTEDLDSGPIIEQDVIRITHQDNIQDMIYMGQNIERSVFIRAIKLHLEERILTYKNKTILLK